MKVGEKIYLEHYNGYGTSYTVGEVVKITPSGMFDVNMGSGVTRFRADGKKSGVQGYHEWYIDFTPFEERKAAIAQGERLKTARIAMRTCTVTDWFKNGSGQPDTASMSNELDRLEEVIRTTRKLISEVAHQPVPVPEMHACFNDACFAPELVAAARAAGESAAKDFDAACTAHDMQTIVTMTPEEQNLASIAYDRLTK
jgi:hypothetical protein